MATWWLVSSVLLWIMVIVLSVTVLAILRELGVRRAEQGASSDHPLPAVRPAGEDGPGIGSPLPDLWLSPINGVEPFGLRDGVGESLLLFLSPMCDGCQSTAEALETVLGRRAEPTRTTIFMRGPEAGTRAFARVFSLQVPVIADSDNSVTDTFDIHHAPFGLFYDAEGYLRRRGVVVEADDLAALLGDASVPEASLSTVFPRPGADGGSANESAHVAERIR